MRWPGHVGNTERREKHRLSVGKLEAKRPVRRPTCRWDIKMDLKNRLEGADWTCLAWDRAMRVGWRLLAWQVRGKVTAVKLDLTWLGIGPRGWGGDFSHGKYEEK
jgi:hypothetical protein